MEWALAAIVLWALTRTAPVEDSGEGIGESTVAQFTFNSGGVNENGRDIDCLHPMLKALLQWADEQPFTTVITSTKRTATQQAALYEIGRSVPNPWQSDGTPLGPTVAPTKDPAQHGILSDGFCHAFDFSYNSMTSEAREAFVAKAESLGLVWGGRWQHPDLVHIETPFWRQYK